MAQCSFVLPKSFKDVYPEMLAVMKSGNAVSFGVLETYGFKWHAYIYRPNLGGFLLYKLSTEQVPPVYGVDGVGKYDVTYRFGQDEYLMMRDLRRALRNGSGYWYIWDQKAKRFDRQCKIDLISFAYNDVREANPKVSCAPASPGLPLTFPKNPKQLAASSYSSPPYDPFYRALWGIVAVLFIVEFFLFVYLNKDRL